MHKGMVDPPSRGLELSLGQAGNAGGGRKSAAPSGRVDPQPNEQVNGIRRFGFWIPGRPVPMERAVSWTGRDAVVRRRNGERSRDYRSRVHGYVLAAGRPSPLLRGPLGLELAVYAEVTSPTGGRRGDLSNFIKAIEDAFNRVVWEDDRDVTSVRAVLLEPALRDDRLEGVMAQVWGS